MNKKILTLALLISAFSVNPACAEKFGSYTSTSTDYTTQNNNLKITATPTIPKTVITSSQRPAMAEPERLETISIPVQQDINTQMPVAIQPAYKPQITAIKPVSTMSQQKITVPSFEKQFQAMIKEQEIKLKKKMTFMESIMNEIQRYGMFIVLILVLLVILYAVHKDKAPQIPHQTQKPTELPKKNIWHEDF